MISSPLPIRKESGVDLKMIQRETQRAYNGRDWRSLPIKESGERLVRVPPKMTYSWYNNEMGLTTDPSVFVREGVLEKLDRARDKLRADGYELKVYDGWRPIELQEGLFWHYLKLFTVKAFALEEHFAGCDKPAQIKTAFSSLPSGMQEKLKEANRQYVSWPTKNRQSPSPHATGGAVDVWLHQNGRPITLGVPFDHMDETAGAFYHLKSSRRPWPLGSHAAVVRNRNALLRAMLGAGFSAYPAEIWHFNAGNQMDAITNGGVASYGYIEP